MHSFSAIAVVVRQKLIVCVVGSLSDGQRKDQMLYRLQPAADSVSVGAFDILAVKVRLSRSVCMYDC